MATRGLNSVLKKLEETVADMKTTAGAAGDLTAAQLQSEAKKNRRWRDRTNAARNSITGSSRLRMGKLTVALAIGVDYGPYLELSNVGRFAIIEPTMRANRTKLAENYKKLSKI